MKQDSDTASTPSVDAALTRLRTELPRWRIYSMGERPKGSLYQPFFCGLVSRAGGRIEMGEGQILARAIERAIGMAKDREAGRVRASTAPYASPTEASHG